MPKSYSEGFLLDLAKIKETNRIGVKLAKVCVEANFPIILVADLFGTSRQTIHNWFRGGAIRGKNQDKIERFLEIVERDLERNIIPATRKETIDYAKTKLVGKI